MSLVSFKISIFHGVVTDVLVWVVIARGRHYTSGISKISSATASIVLVIEGSGKYLASRQITRKGGISVVEPFASDDISPGSVLFLAADKILEVFPENCSKLVLFQAYCNL